jgi:hypothetical protein
VSDQNPEPQVQQIDPHLQLAAQQEQQEADNAQLAHLRQRVPVLRAQLNMATERIQQLEAELMAMRIPAPQDHLPKKRPARKAPVKIVNEEDTK